MVDEFTSPGSFTWTNDNNVDNVKVLVVAGGGGGGGSAGGSAAGGGGGAGGVVFNGTYSTGGSDVSGSVGAGGAGGNNDQDDNGTNGNDSTFGTITAIGGGAGGSRSANGGGALDGGSGGGAGSRDGGAPGNGTTGQGNDGGDAGTATGGDNPAGGGGGAAQVGESVGDTGAGGDGGDGEYWGDEFGDSFGDSGYFAGGGGGGDGGNGGDGLGGLGGGGDSGGSGSGVNAVNGTGGGGAGQEASGLTGTGDGGDGVVLVQELVSAPSNLSVDAVTETTANLSWDAASGEEYLKLYRSQTSGTNAEDYDYVARIAPNQTAYTDSDLQQNESYYYRLSAVGAEAGETSLTNEAIASTTDPDIITWTTREDWQEAQESSAVEFEDFDISAGSGTAQQSYDYGSTTKGIAGYYPMDINNGLTVTDRAMNMDGEVFGAIHSSTNKIGGGSYLFDNTNTEYISIDTRMNDMFIGGGEITLSAYVNANTVSTTGYRGIVGNDYNPSATEITGHIGINSAGEWEFGFYDGSWHRVSTATNVTTGQWVHVAGTYDGNTIRLYVDGVEQITTSDSTGLPAASETWSIGRRWDDFNDTADYWDGYIDDVRIYDRALSSVEIEELAQLTNTSYVSNKDIL